MSEVFDDVRRAADMAVPAQVTAARTSAEVLAGIGLAVGGGGMILGRDRDGVPVVREIFHHEPREILVVGTLGLAKVIAFRALALGAQVWVETRRVAAWESFIRTSAGASGAIQVVREFPDTRFADEDRPMLVVVDSDSSLSEEDQVGTPWTTVLTVYAQLTPWNVADLGQADLVVMQELAPGEIRLAASALRGSGIEDRPAEVGPGEITVIAGGDAQVATPALTSVEGYLIGDIRRARRAAGRPRNG
ncbi:hypothetical protein [Cumulibacter manganitolerans]|uniref:hypothetical protein n=1 Tax=Cumulibacter manganitolerans TaxID=1884992 RepID=UPI0012951B9D|nr:hypothetical protein [Cumulibacter manganitolerans]